MAAQTAVKTARRRAVNRAKARQTARKYRQSLYDRRQSGKTDADRAGDRLAMQLAVCGGAFVLLVAAKVLLPAQAAVLRQSLGGTMGRNLNVQEVFSAVGRAVGGEENGAEEVWQAVFSPLARAEGSGAASDGGTATWGGETAGTEGGTALWAGETAGTEGGTALWDGETAGTDGGTILRGTGTDGTDEKTAAWGTGTGALDWEGGGLSADTELLDGTAYTVKAGQGGIALDVLRQYRTGSAGGVASPPGAGNAARTDGIDPAGPSAAETDPQAVGQSGTGTDPQTGGLANPGSETRYSGKPLPDNVSMEQCILNFAYCTPVFGTLTSGFGWRTDPIQGGERFHHGADLAVPSGTDILCFADGTVAAVGESTSYGKYCIIDHAGGYSTLYAHCSRITAVSGREVLLGEKIAEAGSTGAATGPHLHFELHQGSLYLNPVYYVEHR